MSIRTVERSIVWVGPAASICSTGSPSRVSDTSADGNRPVSCKVVESAQGWPTMRIGGGACWTASASASALGFASHRGPASAWTASFSPTASGGSTRAIKSRSVHAIVVGGPITPGEDQRASRPRRPQTHHPLARSQWHVKELRCREGRALANDRLGTQRRGRGGDPTRGGPNLDHFPISERAAQHDRRGRARGGTGTEDRAVRRRHGYRRVRAQLIHHDHLGTADKRVGHQGRGHGTGDILHEHHES